MSRVDAEQDDMRPEYDFSQLKGKVRGKYIERYRAGTNLVLLEPDVAAGVPRRTGGERGVAVADEGSENANT